MRAILRLMCRIRGYHVWVGLVSTMMCVRCGTVATRGRLRDRGRDER